MTASRIEEVIVTTSTIGDGVEGNPYREVTEYFAKDGTLLFRKDSWQDNSNLKQDRAHGMTWFVPSQSNFNPAN